MAAVQVRSGDPAATEEQLDRLVTGVGNILGTSLIGMYQHDSAVLGGLRPDSDIDVLTVASRPTTREEKRALMELLLAVSEARASPRRGRPIEFDLVVATDIRPWRYPPTFDFHFSELWRDRFESGDAEPWTVRENPDLASVVTVALLGKEPLVGPHPSEVLDPVPRADYIDAVLRDVDTVDEYLPWDTRNVVLTLPRVWSAIATEEVHSKESAARRALGRIPTEHRAVLERALSAYLGDTEASWDDIRVETRAFVDYISMEIGRAQVRAHPDGLLHPAQLRFAVLRRSAVG
jgi:streptomycin 3"-adenylyltransferase